MTQRSMTFWTVAIATLGVAACGGDDAGTTGPTLAEGCDVQLAPSADGDDTEAVQAALIEGVSSGDTLCLEPGHYHFAKELSLNVPDVTLRGLGETRDEVVLDFGEQTEGDDAVTVTSDGFTIEHLSVQNSPGNGVVVTGADRPVFRDLKVSWDAGSVTENGAYAVYPAKCTNVLIEDCEVIGASDAGVYVGQGSGAIVRDNIAHGNVLGIEIENTFDAEVYGNHTYENTAGVAVFLLPNLEQKDAARTLLHDNITEDNNHENFGEEGAIVSAVPPGVGIVVIAADDTEIRDNTVKNNQTSAISVLSWDVVGLFFPGSEDPETDAYPQRTFIHGNTFEGNGTDPQGPLAQAAGATPPAEDVQWDGVEDPDGVSAELCLGESDLPTFRNLDALDFTNQSTDTAPHQCTLPALSGVSL